MVPKNTTTNDHGWVLAFLCHICGAILHLCYIVGPWGVHHLECSCNCFLYADPCHSFCHNCLNILPVSYWRSSLVVAILSMWRINWNVHLWVLCPLFYYEIRHDGFHANIILLWLYVYGISWVLHDAWHCWMEGIVDICSIHIQGRENRIDVVNQAISLDIPIFPGTTVVFVWLWMWLCSEINKSWLWTVIISWRNSLSSSFKFQCCSLTKTVLLQLWMF